MKNTNTNLGILLGLDLDFDLFFIVLFPKLPIVLDLGMQIFGELQTCES